MELVCSFCLGEISKPENANGDTRLTVIQGTMVCADHIPTLRDLIKLENKKRGG